MPAIFGQAAVQPDTEHDFLQVMFSLDPGLIRGYERGGYIETPDLADGTRRAAEAATAR